ncbi:MAG: PEP-CTERM sorting domain-containing protein [Planctomycetota bacterium]|jgi:hypothetical protein
MKTQGFRLGLSVFAVVLASFASPGLGETIIDVTSGTTGTTYNNQSFNETRAPDVTVLGASDLSVIAMTLNEFDIVSGSGTVGARIYDTSTTDLIASADTGVPQGFDQSVTIPISASLLAGQTYRIGFFIYASGDQGSGDLFVPDSFPYTESTGLLQINQGYGLAADAFPTEFSVATPMMEIVIPEPTTMGLLALGGLALLRRRN